ncbi:hypothetical protein, partial [Vibrio cholerae]|uniref:hypothetical protein n=1 Tax=Vibrio cholerae TaxID=666 RepID=UPI001C112A45
FFNTLFFATDWFIYLTLGLVTALAVILARTQSRLNNSLHSKSTSHVKPLARKITSNISTLCHTDW